MLRRVLVVHGQHLFREALRGLLSSSRGFEVVGEAQDGPSAAKLAVALRPSVVILDGVLSGVGCLGVVRDISKATPRARIVVLGHSDRQQTADEMIEAGASGFLPPNASAKILLKSIAVVLSGDVWHPSWMPGKASSDARSCSRRGPRLTQRQLEVLRLMAKGRTTRETAGVLHLSPKTIETHRRHIMDRLDIHSVAGLTKFAVSEGITAL